MRAFDAAGIKNRVCSAAGGEDTRRGELFALGLPDAGAYGFRPRLRRILRRLGEESAYRAHGFGFGHGKPIGIFGLEPRQLHGGLCGPTNRIGVQPVRGRSGCSAVRNGADRERRTLFGDILMNDVVGEARERILAGLDRRFGLIGWGEIQDLLEDLPQVKTLIGELAKRDSIREVEAAKAR